MTNKTKNIISIVITLIFVFIFARLYYVNTLIEKYGVETIGVVNDIKQGRKSDVNFKCKFFVNGRSYSSTGNVNSFEYTYKAKIKYYDLFKVRYYISNPEINEVIADTSYFRLNRKRIN